MRRKTTTTGKSPAFLVNFVVTTSPKGALEMGPNGSGKNVKSPQTHEYREGSRRQVIFTRIKGPKNSSKLYVYTGDPKQPWVEIDSCSQSQFDAAGAKIFPSKAADANAIAKMSPRNGNRSGTKNGKLHSKHQTRKAAKSF